MQIRLDPPNASAVKREADAHRRIFKRHKPYAAVANEWLRGAIDGKNVKVDVVVPK